MDDLHKNQIILLRLLEEKIENPLTIREIQDVLDFSSPSVVSYHIQQLEKKGYLKRNPNNPRDYQIFINPEKPIVYLNQYGNAQCGPSGSILDGNPIARIPIASRLLKFPSSEGFIVIAKGDSMEPQIHEGDFIIAQKQNHANDGDIVVCVYQEDVLIKKFFKQNNHVTLISINSEKYPSIFVDEFFKIEGIVRNIIKYN
ncbi:MAG: LexA family protein [bacterium]